MFTKLKSFFTRTQGYDNRYLRAMLSRGVKAVEDNLAVLERRIEDPRFSHKRTEYKLKAEQLRKLLRVNKKVEGISRG